MIISPRSQSPRVPESQSLKAGLAGWQAGWERLVNASEAVGQFQDRYCDDIATILIDLITRYKGSNVELILRNATVQVRSRMADWPEAKAETSIILHYILLLP